MTTALRIALGLALGALLGALPFVHYRYGAGHAHAPSADHAADHAKEIRHATHTH
jgi:hypothetical protein